MSRIDNISQNGNDGEIYLVEKVARALVGESNPDQILAGQYVGKRRWELHIKQAIEVISIVREFDNGNSNR